MSRDLWVLLLGVGAVLYAAFGPIPGQKQRISLRRKPRCPECKAQCRAVLPEVDGEPLDGGETRRWVHLTMSHDAGTVAAEPEYRRQP